MKDACGHSSCDSPSLSVNLGINNTLGFQSFKYSQYPSALETNQNILTLFCKGCTNGKILSPFINSSLSLFRQSVRYSKGRDDVHTRIVLE